MNVIVVVILNLILYAGSLANDEVYRYVNKEVTGQEEAEYIYKYIVRFSEKYSVDPKLVVSVIKVESNFDFESISSKGAIGLMQVMPFHFNESEVGINISDNLNVGIRELARCLIKNGGDITLALAMYNAGEGAVKKYSGIPPYRETEAYIRKVLNIYNNTFDSKYSFNSIEWKESNLNIFGEGN